MVQIEAITRENSIHTFSNTLNSRSRQITSTRIQTVDLPKQRQTTVSRDQQPPADPLERAIWLQLWFNVIFSRMSFDERSSPENPEGSFPGDAKFDNAEDHSPAMTSSLVNSSLMSARPLACRPECEGLSPDAERACCWGIRTQDLVRPVKKSTHSLGFFQSDFQQTGTSLRLVQSRVMGPNKNLDFSSGIPANIVAGGIAAAHETYLKEHEYVLDRTVALFVVPSNDKSGFEQNLEAELNMYGVNVMRRTIATLTPHESEIPYGGLGVEDSGNSNAKRRLILRVPEENEQKNEISVVYFFIGEECSCKIHSLVKSSRAIECPTNSLLGTRLESVQQRLEDRQVLTKYLGVHDAETIDTVRSCWVDRKPGETATIRTFGWALFGGEDMQSGEIAQNMAGQIVSNEH